MTVLSAAKNVGEPELSHVFDTMQNRKARLERSWEVSYRGTHMHSTRLKNPIPRRLPK